MPLDLDRTVQSSVVYNNSQKPIENHESCENAGVVDFLFCFFNNHFRFNQPPRLPSSEFRPQDQPRLTIIVQPGEHHRARYESEGSRGAVKDESGDGSPKIRVSHM